MTRLIFGFIEPRADFASLTAVIVTVLALAAQMYWFFLGSQVQLMQPEQVFFNRMDLQRVRFVVPLTFHNRAMSQYSEVISDVDMELSIPTSSMPTTKFKWRSYAEFRPLNKEKLIEFSEIHFPISIPGASSVSYEVEFVQEAKQCVTVGCNDADMRKLKWEDFAGAAKDGDRMEIKVIASGIEEAEYVQTCTVVIDDSFLDRIGTDKDHPWHAPPCLEPLELGI